MFEPVRVRKRDGASLFRGPNSFGLPLPAPRTYPGAGHFRERQTLKRAGVTSLPKFFRGFERKVAL